jgi:hypothetical protein
MTITTAQLVRALQSSRTDLVRMVETTHRNKFPLLVLPGPKRAGLGAEGTEPVGEGADLAGGS